MTSPIYIYFESPKSKKRKNKLLDVELTLLQFFSFLVVLEAACILLIDLEGRGINIFVNLVANRNSASPIIRVTRAVIIQQFTRLFRRRLHVETLDWYRVKRMGR